MGRPPKAAPLCSLFLLIYFLYYEYLWIFLIYSLYISYLYVLNIFHICSFVCFVIYSVNTLSDASLIPSTTLSRKPITWNQSHLSSYRWYNSPQKQRRPYAPARKGSHRALKTVCSWFLGYLFDCSSNFQVVGIIFGLVVLWISF